jgi:peptidoglycan hydrolase-like protein with peptidoglycan-binding domain
MKSLQNLGVCIAGAAIALGVAATPALAETGGAPSAVGQATAVQAAARPATGVQSAQSRCLIWTKSTTNYTGLTAGYSWAWNVVVGPGATGDRVKEIQCLTDYYGEGPSALDGNYGPDTTSSVKKMQKRCGLTQDGIVGPDTWRCLRIP